MPVHAVSADLLTAANYTDLVKNWGADPTGAVDCTAAFQAALDWLETKGGGTLFLPPGTYTVCSGTTPTPLYLKSTKPTEITGYGATIKKTTSATFRAIFVSDLRSGQTAGYGAGVCNLTVRGIRFEGVWPNVTLAPFALQHAQNCVFEDLVFYAAQGRGGHIFDMGGCENIVVNRCHFIGQNTSDGTSQVAEAVQIDSSYNGTQTSGTTPSGFSGLPTRNVTVSYCKFLPVTIGGTTYPAPTPMGSHFVSEGKYYEQLRFLYNEVLDPRENLSDNDADDGTAYYRGVLHLPASRDVQVIGNRFRQTVQAGRPNRVISIVGKASGVLASSNPNTSPASTGAWTVPLTPSGIVIRDNYIEGFTVASGETGQEAIYVRGVDAAGGEVTHVTIADNTIIGGWTSGATNRTAIHLQNVRQAVVSGNKIRKYQNGVKIYTSQSISLVNNTMREIYERGIYSISTTGLQVLSNCIEASAGELLQLVLGKAVTITGNTFVAPTGTGTAANGLIIVSVNSLICEQNVILNDTGTTQTRGIALGTPANVVKAIISHNLISGYTTQIVLNNNNSLAGGYTGSLLTGNY